MPLSVAPDALHRCVDDATRDWARRHALELAVIEGRFLDQVLADEPSTILVRVTCRPATRFERWVGRAGGDFCEEQLGELDKADDLFRIRMYGSADKGAAQITLDTSSGGVEEWTNELLALINRSESTGHD